MSRRYPNNCEFVNKYLEVCRRPCSLRKCTIHLGSTSYRPCNICTVLTCNLLGSCSTCELELKREWYRVNGNDASEDAYLIHYLTNVIDNLEVRDELLAQFD
jgi:hypothetical protein